MGEPLLDRVDEIVAAHVQPRAAERDETGAYPSESFRAFGQAGLLGLLVPRRYGGLEESHQTYAAVVERIARACASTAMLFVMHHTYVVPVVDHGQERLKELLLPSVSEGKAVLTGATTEPQGGGGASSVFALERDGDELVINAVKPCVSGANHSDWIAVLIRPDASAEGTVKTLVMAPGVRSSQVKPIGSWNTVGMRATGSSGLEFKRCRVPSWYDLGVFSAFGSGLPTNMLGYSKVWLGLAEVAYDLALSHITQRSLEQIVAERRTPPMAPTHTTVRQTVAMIESVQRQVSEMRAALDAAQALVDSLAVAIDRARPTRGSPIPPEAADDIRRRCASARLTAGETAIDVCRVAMRVCGLRGLQRGFLLERCLRDAITSQPMAPSEDACKVDLGRRLVGLEPGGPARRP